MAISGTIKLRERYYCAQGHCSEGLPYCCLDCREWSRCRHYLACDPDLSEEDDDDDFENCGYIVYQNPHLDKNDIEWWIK